MEKIKPRSGLSRAEVLANQRRRILDGLAAALAYHGYEDTKISDVVELAQVSRPTFYEHFESKEDCFAAAYDDGVKRLSQRVSEAAGGETEWVPGISAGLSAALEFLAAEPSLAHLLLVESLAAARPARVEHEHTLARLADALQPPPGSPEAPAMPEETARLLAGGLASYLSGRVLEGEAEQLADSHDLLLGYLFAPPPPASTSAVDEPGA